MSLKVILASSSPRRKELLEKAGVPFTVLVPDVDETPIKNESPQKMVGRLALFKAKAVAQTIRGDALVVAADTTVVNAAQKNLGKPKDENEAKKMIRSLQGKKHHVYTAYSLIKVLRGKLVKQRVRTIRTDVHIRKMSDPEVAAYVAKGECLDKAGAYAAQGFGMVIIEKISGSYTNVVGLPISQVIDDLKKMGFKNGL